MNIAIISSNNRCGIRDYSLILQRGLQELGHSVRYVGITPHDNRALMQGVCGLDGETELVIIEYEPGIFWLPGLVRALLWLRRRTSARILLSIHEIEPKKYAEFRQARWYLARKVEANPFIELFKLLAGGVDLVLRYFILRTGLLLMGALPHRLIIHSQKTAENIGILLPYDEERGHPRVTSIPLLIEEIPGNKEEARARLGIDPNVFAFISPGFLFRRKRLIEIAEQLPADSELWIVGTKSEHEPDYPAEIEAYIAQGKHGDSVKLIQEYDLMVDHLIAADVAVLYYEESYQSAVAAQAIGAGKPCIFSNLPAFDYLADAALFAANDVALRDAMQQIQQPDTHGKLAVAAQKLRQRYSPAAIAEAYLDAQ